MANYSSTISPQQIRLHPLNDSTSKAQYAFPKEKRFGVLNRSESESSGKFYDIPSTLSKRATGFGYGEKKFLQQNLITPSPNAYNNSSSSVDIRRGITFGVGREKMEQGGFINSNDKFPGPGQYDSNKSQLSKVQYTIGQRSSLGEMKNNIPGPGTYPLLPVISANGKYPISKYQSSGACNFNPSKQSRFLEQQNLVTPAPGHYKSNIIAQQQGQYIVSQIRSSLGRSFTHAERKTFDLSSKVPGPGAYKFIPSDFGQY